MGGSDREALLARLNAGNRGTLMDTLGIVYCDVGDDFLEAAMPVTSSVHQPMGILHGGATAALAETVGSAASALRLDLSRQAPVGLSLSISHLRSLSAGRVIARADATHIGRSTHVWEIRVRDDRGRRIAAATLTMMIIDRANQTAA